MYAACGRSPIQKEFFIMAIKMRVLYNSKKKGMAQFASAVAAKYELPINATSGKFPPEYPCDKERTVILGLSVKGELSDEIRRFCAELNKTRAANVALLVDGDQPTADKIAEIIKNAGTNLVGTKVISFGGFLMFGGTLTPELETELVAWVEEMVAGCK
jgi:hypothetical protein